jgi:hypothetical protein
VLRRLIRGYIEQRTGKAWTPAEPKKSGRIRAVSAE